ncbi:MAG: hypothetical protein HYW27_00095 [Candidatus Aenigmarchaeota archaeon]|nr:hypothetical protein [Candidatus Aenigmarchaeota archaeon]
MPRQIATKTDVERCETGDVVEKDGRIGIYAGPQMVRTCGCSSHNMAMVPVVIYPRDGGVEREEIYSMDASSRRRINGISILGNVGESDPLMPHYRKLLQNAGLLRV